MSVERAFRPLPEEVDLSQVRYMPLYMDRLKKSKSWLRAKASPALGFYLMNAWMYAVTERPAASIEDDPDVWMAATECHPEAWPRMRDSIRKGWVQIGGRWHHPALAGIALEMWLERLKGRYEAMLGAERVRRNRARKKGEELPLFDASFELWMREHYPETHAYVHQPADVAGQLEGEAADGGEVISSHGENEPKPLNGNGEGASSSGGSGRPVTRNVSVTSPLRNAVFGPKVREGRESSPPLLPPPRIVENRAQGPPPRAAAMANGHGSEAAGVTMQAHGRLEKSASSHGHGPASGAVAASGQDGWTKPVDRVVKR